MESTTVRDDLALVRTRLANERTFLAYLRTALALFAGAAVLLQFFQAAYAPMLAWLLVGGGVLALSVGIFRCLRVSRRLASRRADQ